MYLGKYGLLYSAPGLDSWAGFTSMCRQERSDCKIQVVMITVISTLARQD